MVVYATCEGHVVQLLHDIKLTGSFRNRLGQCVGDLFSNSCYRLDIKK